MIATIEGAATEMLPAPEQVRVKLEVRRGGVLSEMKTATSGFDDRSKVATIGRDPNDPLRMATSQVALRLREGDIATGPVSVHLLDAETGVELERLVDVPLSVM